MSQSLDQLVAKIPLTVWVAVIAAAAAWGGTYTLMSSQVAANASEISDIRQQREIGRAQNDARLRNVEDDNRDQKADIARIDSAQKDVAATLRVFQDDTRNRFEYLMISTQRLQTTLENMASASGIRLPNDPPTVAPTRPGR